MSHLLVAFVLGAALAPPQQPNALEMLRIEGVVVGLDRLPVANCEVWVGDDPAPRTRTFTDGSGGFLLFAQRRQFVAVHARSRGVGVGAFWVDGMAGAPAIVRVQLLPSRELTGVVRAADGTPVEGAFVTAQPNDIGVLAMAFAGVVTGADGSYRLHEVVLGPITVRAIKAGYGAVRIEDDGRAPSLDLEIDPDEARTLTVTIEGTEPPQLERANVRLLAELDGIVAPLPAGLTLARFDADGSCVLRGLPPRARVHIEVDLPGAVLDPADDFMPVAVRTWTSRCRVDAAPALLRGRLVDDLGTPCAGAVLAAVDPNAAWQMQRPQSARTDADGVFALRAPVGRGARVQLTLLEDARMLPLERDESAAAASFDFDPTTRLELQAIAAPQVIARFVDANGRPLAGAAVQFFRAGQGEVATDLDGRIRFTDRTGDPAASIRLLVNEPSGAGVWERPVADVSPQDLGTLAVTAGASIHGRALDADGGPVPGARVWLAANDGGTQCVIAGKDGEYEFACVAAGAWQLAACRSGIAEFSMQLDLRAGDEIQRDLLVP